MADHPRIITDQPQVLPAYQRDPLPPFPASIVTPDNPPDDSSEPAAKRRRATQSVEGCIWCRKKKIKCAGKPDDGGSCANCLRDELLCSFIAGPGKVSRVTPSHDVTEAGTPRKRAQRACKECHAHKTKCSGELPRCKRCLNLGLGCVYEPSKRKFSSAPGSLPPVSVDSGQHSVPQPGPPTNTVNFETNQLMSPTASSVSPGVSAPTRRGSLIDYLSAEDILAQKDLLTRHFHVWFNLFGCVPLMSVLHPPSIFLEIEEKRLNPILAKVVCAITTRIICPKSRKLPEFAERCIEQVDGHISRSINSVLRDNGRDTLIILLIAICHNWLELQMGKVWMYMGLAGRMITALQLNLDNSKYPPIQQEITRRMVWAIWKLDRFLAAGFEEHFVLRDDYMHLRSPDSDISFPESNNAPPEGSLLIQSISPQVSASQFQQSPLCFYHIRLHRVRHRILTVTKRLVYPQNSDPRRLPLEASQVINRVNLLQSTLTNFNQSLPENLKFSSSSINRWVNSPEGGSFILLWTTFWELYIDLYQFSIPGLEEEADPELARQLPVEFMVHSQKQAVAYAITLSRFWRSVQEIVAMRPLVNGTERLQTVDQTMVYQIIQSTKVLLAARKHGLFQDLEEGSTAPLIRQEPVTNEALDALIQSNMGLFDQFEYYYPVTIELMTRNLRAAVEDFKRGNPYNNLQEIIRMPARRPSDNIRLPGPHLILESANMSPHHDQRSKQRNMSASEHLMSQKMEQNPDDSIMVPTDTTAREEPTDTLPDVPKWLNYARTHEIPSGVPILPQGNTQGSYPSTPSFITPPSEAGQHMVNSRIDENAGNGALGVYSPPVLNPAPGNLSVGYGRAIPGGIGPITTFQHPTDYDHYERAGGKRLPFPNISTLLR